MAVEDRFIQKLSSFQLKPPECVRCLLFFPTVMIVPPPVAMETCIIDAPVKTETVSAVGLPETHLVADQVPLLVVVVLTEDLCFVRGEIHCVLKQEVQLVEDKFPLMRIHMGLENVSPSETSPNNYHPLNLLPNL